jgi:hypothetical protein
MFARRAVFSLGLCACIACALPAYAQKTPSASSPGRIIVLPSRLVAGAPATLAVLDVQGRLTPGVTLQLTGPAPLGAPLGANSSRITTDQTGRVVFTAPASPGVLLVQFAGRPGKVASVVIPAAEAASNSLQVVSYPRVVTLADRFEILGTGFRGEADANQVTMGGAAALVLAASPVSLVVFPVPGLEPGPAGFEVASSGRKSSPLPITLVALELNAVSARLDPGQRRTLTVRARGTRERLTIEARNLAPNIAELVGGNPLRAATSGGEENTAEFEVVGRSAGDFLISMRLVTRPTKVSAEPAPPRP